MQRSVNGLRAPVIDDYKSMQFRALGRLHGGGYVDARLGLPPSAGVEDHVIMEGRAMTQLRASAPSRARLRRLIPEPQTTTRPAKARVATIVEIIVLVVTAGLVTGFCELTVTLWHHSRQSHAPLFFRGNRHILWAIPTINLAIFLVMGILCVATKPVWRKAMPRLPGQLAMFLSLFCVLLANRGLYEAACLLLALGLTWRLEPWVARFGKALRRVALVASPLLVVAWLALVGATIGRERFVEAAAVASLPPISGHRPNVLLIVLDTVRADHLSVYGYNRPTTPELEHWLDGGTRFARAYSTAPWTLPSHASMFTGHWPHILAAGLKGPLDARQLTLAEALRNRGYLTAGFVSNTIYCSAETGLARGFQHYEDHILTPWELLRTTALGGRLLYNATAGPMHWLVDRGLPAWLGPGNPKHHKEAATLNRDLLSWLDRRDASRPFFAFLNYFDAHHPYVLPAGTSRHFGIPPAGRDDVLLLHRWWSMDKRHATPRQQALVRDAYDDCLRYLDSQLGVLFRELDRRGLWDDTVVIVTADHGEHLGEHNLHGHAGSLYAPEVHVPLLVRYPGEGQGAVVEEPVSNRDVAATVADVAGLPAIFPGETLRRYSEPEEDWEAEISSDVLTQVEDAPHGPANGGRSPVFRGAMRSIIRDAYVYIRNGDGRVELFNQEKDPGELNNLVDDPAAKPILESLRRALNAALKDHDDASRLSP